MIKATNIEILETVCQRFGLSAIEVRLGGRTDKYCRARWTASYFLFKKETLNLSDVGRYLERDHSSIIYGLKRLDEMTRADIEFAECIWSIEKQLESDTVSRRVCG